MKLDRVTLENFGIYTRKTLQFDAAPLVLIYGPNESGKTTALNGLRQALFGFKMRTPYLTNRPMSAEVSGRMSDGRPLEFVRRKGRQDDVVATLEGRSVSSEEVQALLCNLDLASYEQLFGFSLDELRSGESALKSARLSEALAGGGLGGMNALQSLRLDLQQSLSELYKPRGSTSKINVKLLDIKKRAESLRGVQVLPAEVEDIRSALDELLDRGEQVRKSNEKAIHSKLAAERLRAALPKYRQRVAFERQLLAMDLPNDIDMAFVAQWSDFADQRKELLSRLKEDRATFESEITQLEELGGSQEISEAEADIERLGHQAAEISTLRSRLADLTDRERDAQTHCARLLESLELEECNEQLLQFSVSVQTRNELEEAAREHASVSDEIIATEARLDSAEDSLASINHAPNVMDDLPENVDELSNFVQEIQQLERELKLRVTEFQRSVEDAEFVALTDRLKGVLGNDVHELHPNWSLPSAQRIQQHQRAFEDGRREISQSKRIVSKLEKDLSINQRELEQLDRRDADTMLSNAATIRAARDAVITQWLDDLSQPLIAASVTTNDQRERLQELQRLAANADSLQASMLEAADALAIFNQKTQQIEHQQSELTRAKKLLDEHLRGEQSLLAEWSQIWTALPFEPASADVMLTWVRDFAVWLSSARELEQKRRELHVARGVVRNKRAELQDHWPTVLRDDTATDVLLSQVRRWQDTLRDAERDSQRLLTATSGIAKLKERLSVQKARQAELKNRFDAWLVQLPFSINWPISQVGTLLESIEQLRRETTSARKAASERRSIEEKLAVFSRKTLDLATTLGCDIASGNPESHAARWLAELQAMREQRTKRIQINASLEHRKKRIAETEKRLQGIESKLAALSTAVGGGDTAKADTLVERVRLADSLRTQIAELNASIEPHGGSQTASEFNAHLEQADEAQLEVELQELTRELQSLDESRKQIDQDIGSLTQKMEQLANNVAAQRDQQLLQDERGELAEMSEQWAVQRLAQELLSRSIERFAADHEPALLLHTRDYLQKLTHGRYMSVEHDNAKQGNFVVRNARQESFTPDQLSTGTREQLYLAIRMAFITHHCEHHEALPVIMDDCFVNFDDRRIRHALEAIANWDDSIQTILLSCHWRVVQELADFAPSTLVLHLEKDLLTTVGELVASNQVLSH